MTHQDIRAIYDKQRKTKLFASSLLLVILASLLVMSAISEKKVDRSIRGPISSLPYYGAAPDLRLINTDNQYFNLSNDESKIHLVNFFYTKCPGDRECALTTLKMAQLFAKIRQNNLLSEVRFVSIDFDYENDKVEDLREYAKRYTADTENWQFLYGNKTEIEQVTSDWDVYFKYNNFTEPPSEEFPPIDHDLIVYVIDQNGIIRNFLLANIWEIDFAFEVIEYLLNQNP